MEGVEGRRLEGVEGRRSKEKRIGECTLKTP